MILVYEKFLHFITKMKRMKNLARYDLFVKLQTENQIYCSEIEYNNFYVENIYILYQTLILFLIDREKYYTRCGQMKSYFQQRKTHKCQ